MLFDKNAKINTRHIISKMDKKKINKSLNRLIFDLKKEYEYLNLKNNIQIIKLENKFLYFKYNDKLYPTIQNFDKEMYKRVYLDDGAIEPIKRGAKIMAPGVLKYLEKSDKFDKGEIVGVEIIDNMIIGVGYALVSYQEMIRNKEGAVIEILHVIGDKLYEGNL